MILGSKTFDAKEVHATEDAKIGVDESERAGAYDA